MLSWPGTVLVLPRGPVPVGHHRAYLSSALVRDRGPDLAIFRKAWRVRNTGGRFAKDQFTLDFAAGQLTCLAGVTMPFQAGKTVRFPAGTCAACPLRQRCTTSSHGRSVSIHPDETLLAELRRRQQDPDGRTKLRERVAVEHALATSGSGRAAAPATWAPARTCSTCAASPSSTTSTSSPASPPPIVTSWPPDSYLTGALGGAASAREGLGDEFAWEPSGEPLAADIGPRKASLDVRYIGLNCHLATWSIAGRLREPRSHGDSQNGAPIKFISTTVRPRRTKRTVSPTEAQPYQSWD